MSEGELGFVYTSNSYSSGEIKPLDNNRRKDRSTLLFKAQTGERINVKTIQDSSSDSISTGELKKILSTEDKLDEDIDNALIDFQFRCDSRISSGNICYLGN